MKAAGVFFSVVAVVAGVYVARLEYERERESQPSLGQPAARGVPREESPVETPPGASEEPADATRAVAGAPSGDARGEGSRQGTTAEARHVSTELQRRGATAESLLANHKFDKAAAAAHEWIAELEREGVPPTHELAARARRLEAKARVFGQLVDTIERPAERPLVSQVFLANGNTIEAVRVERQGERYVLKLANGIVYRPPAEQVLEVREMSREQQREFLRSEWQRLSRRLRKIEDPIELYVRGVERCYRSGLEGEGLALLERLLTMPGSGKIPLRFAGGNAATAVRDWEIAAGRVSEVARHPDTGSTTVGDGSRTGANQGTALTGSRPDRPESPEPVLKRIRALRDAARLAYQRGFGEEGEVRALGEARQRLEEAFALIESLDASDEVDQLRRELGQLLSDVVRVSPF